MSLPHRNYRKGGDMSDEITYQKTQDDEQYPGEDTCFHVDEHVEQDGMGGGFAAGDIPDSLIEEPGDEAEPRGDGGSLSILDSAPERLSLEERLKKIADKPDDVTYLFGTCDRELLEIMSTIAPRLQMRGATGGYAYVSPAVSLAKALKDKCAADVDMVALERVIDETQWLADAWEKQGSATAMEVMRNLVLREVLRDLEMRRTVLLRIRRCLAHLCETYDEYGVDLRKRSIF